MKSRLKALAEQAGFAIVRRSHRGARYLERPPESPLDDVLLRLFPRLDGLTFLQVGANDGLRADPIRDYVLRYRWRGLLLEPMPSLFAQLQRNYADCPELSFLNAALDVQAGSRTLYYFGPECGSLPDWAFGLGTFDRARLEALLSDFHLPPSAIHEQTAPTLTWADALRKLPDGRCDLLVLDTEGADVTLLDALDLQQDGPRVIQFEHACVSQAEHLRALRRLMENGYEIATHGGDTIAHRRIPR